MQRWEHERGQIMVLLVAAIVGLFALAALAIDGGMTFSDRRNAQNAADAAALAGAYAVAHNPSADAIDAAEQQAKANGFEDRADGSQTVEVHFPPISGTYEDNPQYIQVFITSKVDTSLLHFAYSGEVKNTVESVAHYTQAVEAPLYDGNALVALAPHECGALNLGGNSNTFLAVGGIFVNSKGDDSHTCHGSTAYAATGGGNMKVTSPSISSVGPIDPSFLNESDPDVHIGSIKLNAPQYPYPPGISLVPPPTCAGKPDAVFTDTHSSPPTSPTYSPATPGGIAVIPKGTNLNTTLIFNPGVYCIDSTDFSLNGHADINANGVMFFVTSIDPGHSSNPCDWHWTGSGGGGDEPTIHIYGPGTDGTPTCNGQDCDYKGIIIYVDPLDFDAYPMDHEVNLAGNTGSIIQGTVYAPTCHVKNVGTQSYTVNGQIIGYDFQNAGSNQFSIIYNANNAGRGITPAYLDQSK